MTCVKRIQAKWEWQRGKSWRFIYPDYRFFFHTHFPLSLTNILCFLSHHHRPPSIISACDKGDTRHKILVLSLCLSKNIKTYGYVCVCLAYDESEQVFIHYINIKESSAEWCCRAHFYAVARFARALSCLYTHKNLLPFFWSSCSCSCMKSDGIIEKERKMRERKVQ